MPRRERATIVGDILRKLDHLEAQENVTPTRLAALANLPYDRFQIYLRDLQKAGLIASDPPVRLTDAGRDFLRRYEQWLDALRLLGLSMDAQDPPARSDEIG